MSRVWIYGLLLTVGFLAFIGVVVSAARSRHQMRADKGNNDHNTTSSPFLGRLWIHIALLSAGSIGLTVLIIIAVQDLYFARTFNQLPAVLKTAIEQIQNQSKSGLSEDAQWELIRSAMQQVVNDPEGFRQFMMQLMGMVDIGRRSPRIAAIISFPFNLMIAVVIAWFIVQPIQTVTRAAHKIAQGDLSARAYLLSRKLFIRGELAELVRNFNTMAESLEKLELERKDMIADIAHELRTPLTVLQGQIDAMSDGIRPLNQESLDRLNRQTQLLARLIQDLRTLSLADAKRLSLNARPINLNKFMTNMMNDFAVKASTSNVTLEFVPEAAPIMVNADPDRLEQVVGNLIDNGLRYTPAGGQIMLSVGQQDEQAMICIADDGPGLPEDAIGQIFDRFYRVEQSRGRSSGGSGLGLAIAKALVELHQGSISVRNAETGGAVFTILLPLYTPQLNTSA